VVTIVQMLCSFELNIQLKIKHIISVTGDDSFHPANDDTLIFGDTADDLLILIIDVSVLFRCAFRIDYFIN